MKATSLARAALAASLVSVPAMAAPAAQPPMNDFRQAFYDCDGGSAFLIAYDSTKPKQAVMTLSGGAKEVALKRDQMQGAVQFSSGSVKFWTDGTEVRVEGTEAPLTGCKRKT